MMIKNNKSIDHEGIRGNYDDSSIIIFGVPFDGTASYRPGTRFGPQYLKQELNGIETYSPYLDKDLIDYKICDSGDMPFNFGSVESILSSIKANTREILSDNKKTVAIGGEHLVTLPIVEAYLEKYPGLHVIHLDAHTDLRDEFMGENLSHATVMRRIFEQMKGRLWQFGIRSGTGAEFSFARENIDFYPFSLDGMEKPREALGLEPVYLTIDIDVLDPSIMPGTGTPEAGGVTFRELLDGLLKLNGLNIVGADIVELSPHYDHSGVSTAAACKVLREVLLMMV